jgi:phosphomannomutase
VRKEKADLGVCFDGDADRCVIVDEKGADRGVRPPDGGAVPVLPEASARDGVVYDLRSTKAVPEEIEKAGGKPVRGASGTCS